PAPPAPSAEPPPPPTPLALRAAVGPALDTSALPDIAFGIAAQVGIDIGRLGLGASFLGLPKKSATLSDSTAGGSFSLLAGGLFSCVRAIGPLAPCAGFELGSVGASGTGVRTTRTEHVLWKAGTLGAAAPIHWGAIGVRPEAWIVFPIAMPDFVIDEVGVVHTPRIGVRAALSLELTIL
ncbi:MAG: hypothetical protein ACXWUE_41030, partial [Polyangiales bacterium]